MTTIAKDNRDATLIQKREALISAAAEINRRHKALEARTEAARSVILETCEEAISIARIVESAHTTLGGKGFKDWWDEQKLPVGWCSKYLTLARTAERETLGDKDQMRLIGIIPESESHNEGNRREQDDLGWIKHIGKARQVLTIEKLKTMNSTERHVAKEQLRPLVEMFNAIEAME